MTFYLEDIAIPLKISFTVFLVAISPRCDLLRLWIDRVGFIFLPVLWVSALLAIASFSKLPVPLFVFISVAFS